MDSSGRPYFGWKPCCWATLLKLAKSPTSWCAVSRVTFAFLNLSTAAWMSDGLAKTAGQPKLYVTICDDGIPACWNHWNHLFTSGWSQLRYVKPIFSFGGMLKNPRSLRANTVFLSMVSNSLMLKRNG